MRVKCSWLHCESVFEGRLPPSWALVARHMGTGELVVVCPEHREACLEGEREVLRKLFRASFEEVPTLAPPEDGMEPTRRLGRPSK